MTNPEQLLCYVIDDENDAIDRLVRLIGKICPDWQLVSFTSPKKLLQQSKLKAPDVLFLDVEMPDQTGFELLQTLRKNKLFPIAVYVTGFEHYAIKAIRDSALDYLVKPVDIDELKRTISKIKDTIQKPLLADEIDKLSILTSAEKEVLKHLTCGCTSQEVANKMNLSINTINTHRNHILHKMDCRSILNVLHKIRIGH
jgi:two-component system, LytTR family, response regulator